MSQFHMNEGMPSVDFEYFQRPPDVFDDNWNVGAVLSSHPYYHYQQFELDPRDQLLDRVEGMSMGLGPLGGLDMFSRSREEPYIPQSAQEFYKQGFAAANLYQESFPTQPGPYKLPMTAIQPRQPSPIETIASSSSGFEQIFPYSTDSVISDVDSNGSPLPFSPGERAFHYSSIHDVPSYNKDPCCTLKEIQSRSDEDQEPSVPYINDHEFLNPGIGFKEECAYPIVLTQSSYGEYPSIEDQKYHSQSRRSIFKWASDDDFDDDEKDSDYMPKRSASRKSTQPSSRQKQTIGLSRSKVSKRVSSKTQPSRSTAEKQHIQTAANSLRKDADPQTKTSPFSCPLTPYGCNSTFKSKNEWKRHIVSRHLFLGFWRCDSCPDSDTRPNDFNRKDLFTEHLRRMHHPQKDAVVVGATKPSTKTKKTNKKAKKGKEGQNEPADPATEKFENSLEEVRDRCWKHIRESPRKAFCAFCDKQFEGPGSFDEWLEHAGQHLSELSRQNGSNKHGSGSAWDPQIWVKDTTFRDWLKDQGFLTEDSGDGQFRLVDDERAHEINMRQLQKNETS